MFFLKSRIFLLSSVFQILNAYFMMLNRIVTQLTLEQHRSELSGSTYMWIFFSINILENCLEICDNLKKLSDKPHSLEKSQKLRKS